MTSKLKFDLEENRRKFDEAYTALNKSLEKMERHIRTLQRTL